MNWLDVALLVVGGLVVLWGLRLGLFKAIFLAIGVIVGLVLAGQISESLAGRLTDTVKSESVAAVLAYAFVLLAVIVISVVAGTVLRKILSILFLGWLDSLGGLLLGGLVGLLLGFALIAVLARLAFVAPQRLPGAVGPVETRQNLERALLDSALVPYFLQVYDKLPGSALGMAPGDYRSALDLLKERRAEGGKA